MNTFKKKLSYIWDYYKFHIIGTPLGILFLSYVISAFIGSKENPFCVYFINQNITIDSCSKLEDKLSDELSLTNGINSIYVDDSLIINPNTPDADSQITFTAAISGHIIDIMVSDELFFKHYAKMETFADLKKILPADLYEALNPYILYAENKEGIMVSYGLDLSSCPYLTELRLREPILTIAKYSGNQEICISFLRLLFYS